MDVVYPSNGSFYTFQIDEKILNKKELEFYKWEGSLSQLLQDVRAKLNQVASVSLIALFSCSYFFFLPVCLSVLTRSHFCSDLVPGREKTLPGGGRDGVHLFNGSPPPHIHLSGANSDLHSTLR
jgi:hypothetical protein